MGSRGMRYTRTLDWWLRWLVAVNKGMSEVTANVLSYRWPCSGASLYWRWSSGAAGCWVQWRDGWSCKILSVCNVLWAAFYGEKVSAPHVKNREALRLRRGDKVSNGKKEASLAFLEVHLRMIYDFRVKFLQKPATKVVQTYGNWDNLNLERASGTILKFCESFRPGSVMVI